MRQTIKLSKDSLFYTVIDGSDGKIFCAGPSNLLFATIYNTTSKLMGSQWHISNFDWLTDSTGRDPSFKSAIGLDELQEITEIIKVLNTSYIAL